MFLELSKMNTELAFPLPYSFIDPFTLTKFSIDFYNLKGIPDCHRCALNHLNMEQLPPWPRLCLY
jgi:hypothetical protein